MKMVVFGYNRNGELIVDYFLKKGYEIPIVITPDNNESKINRLKKIVDNKTLIIPYQSFSVGDLKEIIENKNPDTLISCSFTRKIDKELLIINGKNIINIHGAILPDARGSNMINWALVKNFKKTGITLHYLEETIDSGDILTTIQFPINFDDDAVTLKQKWQTKLIELLDSSWDKIRDGSILPKKQDLTQGYYYPSRKPEDGLIKWDKNAIDIYNLVRALVAPFPGAFTYYNGKKLIVDKVEIIYDNKVSFKAGKIIEQENDFIIVSTLYNKIKILKAHFDNGKMDGLDFNQFKLNTFFNND